METLDAISIAEWAGLAVYARAVFGRAADPQDITEFRLTVRHPADTLPGLSVIEWEFIAPSGMAVAGGEL